MKRKLLLLGLAALLALCCGCRPIHGLLGQASPQKGDAIPERLVTQIDVCTVQGSSVEFATYTAQEEMSPILRLLRVMQTREQPDSAVQENAPQIYYTITTTYVNGKRNHYELMDGQYMRQGSGEWLRMDSGKYAELEQLLQELAAPTVPSEETEATGESTGA